MLEGAESQTQKLDTRASITLQRLQSMLQALKRVCASSYEVHLFREAFWLAFFGFLLVGELTCNTLRGHNPQPLLDGDIIQSKTDQMSLKTTLFLSETGDLACPVSSVSSLPRLYQTRQFLVHFEGSPLARYQFSTVLAKTVQFCNITGEFRSHSSRIGAATESAMRGILDHKIKQWGKWKSMSYASYIRFVQYMYISFSYFNQFQVFIGLKKVVWVIGSSMVYWAARPTSTRPGGKVLTLQTRNITILWYRITGMRSQDSYSRRN